MTLATPEYLRQIAGYTSGNRDMYRNACLDAADEIERLIAQRDEWKAKWVDLAKAALIAAGH